MIDLTAGSLPNTLCVNGRDYSIYTDFRLWMKFEIAVSRMGKEDKLDVSYLFKNECPEYCDIQELFKFSRPVRVLPRQTGHNGEIVLDYEIDADLIFSAVLGQYGIDLVDVKELHWHKFLALIYGLNNSTKLLEVMQFRSYRKNTDKDYDAYEEMKWAWRIEPPISEAEQAELDEFSSLFTQRSKS